MKFRRHIYYNTKENKPAYGIQFQAKKGAVWGLCGDNGGPFLFTSEEERDTKLKALRKEHRAEMH